MYTYPRPQNLAYPARVLSSEGRFMRRSEVGQSESLAGGATRRSMRRPRLCFANADSGGLGIPPGPTMGACHEMAGRGAGDGGKSVVIGGPLACLLCLRRAGRG